MCLAYRDLKDILYLYDRDTETFHILPGKCSYSVIFIKAGVLVHSDVSRGWIAVSHLFKHMYVVSESCIYTLTAICSYLTSCESLGIFTLWLTYHILTIVSVWNVWFLNCNHNHLTDYFKQAHCGNYFSVRIRQLKFIIMFGWFVWKAIKGIVNYVWESYEVL